jgi:hypothetical protein
MKSHDDKFEP